jgi:hypothetical protein
MAQLKPGDICRVCTRPWVREEYDGGEIVEEGCSEFCARVTEQEMIAFLTMKEGEFGVWPCSECGCPTEGDFTPSAWCASCDPAVQLRNRNELLKEAQVVIERLAQGSVSEAYSLDLVRRIKEAVTC